MKTEKTAHLISNIARRYGLKILHLDFTDTTLISRVGLSQEVFIQIYVNADKKKTNLSLIVSDERIYGIDNEGGSYHEHPFDNPLVHVDSEPIEIEDFVVKSLEYLKKMTLLG